MEWGSFQREGGVQGVMIRAEHIREQAVVVDPEVELGIHSNMVRARAVAGVLVGEKACQVAAGSWPVRIARPLTWHTSMKRQPALLTTVSWQRRRWGCTHMGAGVPRSSMSAMRALKSTHNSRSVRCLPSLRFAAAGAGSGPLVSTA